MSGRVCLLCIHADEDSAHQQVLKSHLSSLAREGIIESWHPGLLAAGDVLAEQFAAKLAQAQVVLLLLSADLMASEPCQSMLDQVQFEQGARDLQVVPVLARPVDWGGIGLQCLPALPRNGKAVSLWTDRDAAWLDVAAGIRALLTGTPATAPSAAPGPLHRLPRPPSHYRPHEDEPPFEGEPPVRLIAAISGAGKTSWAAANSQRCSDLVLYFDIGDSPDDALATSLARELKSGLGVLLNREAEELHTIGSGLASLHALERALKPHAQVVIVMDNVHRAAARTLRGIVQAMPSIRWLLLAQPWPGQSELEALLETTVELLRGWSVNSIAAELSLRLLPISLESSQRIHNLTGGMPLFVQNVAQLAKLHYRGDVGALCADLEKQTHVLTTAQEAILGRIIETLTPLERLVAAQLLLIDLALPAEDILRLCSSTSGGSAPQVARVLRILAGHGILQHGADGHLALHDAFRLPLAEARSALTSEAVAALRHQLRNLLADRWQTHRIDQSLFRRFLRLLAELGENDTLVDLISSDSEHVYEVNVAREVSIELARIAGQEEMSSETRMWALDTLIFWSGQREDWDNYERRLAQMEDLISRYQLGPSERMRLVGKQMIQDARRQDFARARARYREAISLAAADPDFVASMRYNWCYVLCKFSDESQYHEEAEREIARLIDEYQTMLGITELLIVSEGFSKMPEMLNCDPAQLTALKRLADSMDLYATVRLAQGKPSNLKRISAYRLYEVSQDIRSMIRTGLHVVEECVEAGDLAYAMRMLEQRLLPTSQKWELHDQGLFARALRAKVLACEGELASAREEIERLAPAAEGLPQSVRGEFEQVRRQVLDLVEGRCDYVPNPNPAWRGSTAESRHSTAQHVYRNEACPCGSGRKYMRCCLR